jgi:hypothetical protein
MIYQVAYDLNRPNQDYQGLIETIKSFDGWCSVQKSLWFVCHEGNASDVYDIIAPFVDRNDLLLVSAFTSNYKGWLQPRVWQWVERHSYHLHGTH